MFLDLDCSTEKQRPIQVLVSMARVKSACRRKKIKIKERVTSARSCYNNVTGNTASKPVRENTNPFGCLLSATSSQGILGNYLYQRTSREDSSKRRQTRCSVPSDIHEKKM